jgi:hypothetical protein
VAGSSSWNFQCNWKEKNNISWLYFLKVVSQAFFVWD